MKLAALTSAIAFLLLSAQSLAQTAPEVATVPSSLQRYASMLEGRSQAELDYLADFSYYEQLTSFLSPGLIQSSINAGYHACDRNSQEWDEYIQGLRDRNATEARIRVSESARIAALTHLCPPRS